MVSFMTSPRTITLFTQNSDLRRPPVSIMASALVHLGAVSLVSFGVLYNPPVITHAPLDRYSLRRLDLKMPDLEGRRAVADAIPHPSPHHASHPSPAGGKQSALMSPPVPKAKIGPQTLIQPDLHTNLTLAQETPLPQVMLWSPVKTPVVKIVAPLPQKPPTAMVRPSLAAPVPEPTISDVAIASTIQPSLKQLIVPGTTTPVVVQGPPKPATTPATVSQTSAIPTPAAVVSLSDVQMKKGTVALPPVNEVVATKASAAPGDGKVETQSAGSGAGTGKSSGAHAGEGPAEPASAQDDTGAGSKNAIAGPGQGNQLSATVISLPTTGQFGAVIVGSSLEDQYPEITDVWQGRMAYTVYLHVGTAKSWILQYSLPRAMDARSAGAVVHLDAPWPYSIVRPNLSPGSVDADALMIHGYVNNAGRFETLSVVFPAQYPEAQFVLDSLERWQFRPASQNGQIAKVEVLLIIPEQFE
jgi:hypothetical protein